MSVLRGSLKLEQEAELSNAWHKQIIIQTGFNEQQQEKRISVCEQTPLMSM